MRLLIGTSKGIVMLDPDHNGAPLMALADPSSVWCMAQDSADPELLYAGTVGRTDGKGALFRSTDGGRSWSDSTPRAALGEEVWALAAAPDVKDRVYVGTSHARIFRSDDRGRSFAELEAFLEVPGRERWTFPPPPHIPHVRSIAFDPRDPRTMYVGVEVGGLFRSRDCGESFDPLNAGLYVDVHTVAVDPGDSQRLYATTGDGFYRSDDGGLSWRHIKAGLNRGYTVPLLIAGGLPGAVFTVAAAAPPPMWSVGTAGADAMMFRSIDGAQSFEPIASAGGSWRGMVMRLKGGRDDGEFFGVSTDGTVMRSTDGGASVSTVASNLPPAYDLVTFP